MAKAADSNRLSVGQQRAAPLLAAAWSARARGGTAGAGRDRSGERSRRESSERAGHGARARLAMKRLAFDCAAALAILSCAQSDFAATVHGRVNNGTTGKPGVGVEVVLIQLKG